MDGWRGLFWPVYTDKLIPSENILYVNSVTEKLLFHLRNKWKIWNTEKEELRK